MTQADADSTPPSPAPEVELAALDSQVRTALMDVVDPEIGLDIVSLGLVRNVDMDDAGTLLIDMTMTTPYCPYAPMILQQSEQVCKAIPGIDQVRINLVWSPPWDPRVDASEEARLALGIW